MHCSLLFTALLASAIIMANASCKKTNTSGEPADNYTHVAADDAAMVGAIANAQSTQGEFITALRNPKPTFSEFSVKKPYPSPSGGQEHMWINRISERDGRFVGVIANEAQETNQVRFGQEVEFRMEEISDWKYHDGGKLIGGFTIRYFYDRLSAAEKAEFVKELGLTME